MKEIEKFIFLFLIGTTLLNLLIAIAARIKSHYKEFNKLILYWVAVFMTYGAVVFLHKTPDEIAFSFFFQAFSVYLLSRMLSDSRQITLRLKIYIPLILTGMAASTWLILSDATFTVSVLPIVMAVASLLLEPIWNTLVTCRKESNWIEKGMAYVFITGVIHSFNFAFFRLEPDTAWWGWSVSIAQYQCISIFIPLLINHRRSDDEKKNVGQVIGKLSGKDIDLNQEVEELYRTLEIQIAQKEELNQKLSSANLHLEEEREMNEILIKTISHDLANPLTVIKSYLEMLSTGRIPEGDLTITLEKIRQNTTLAQDMIKRIRNAILTRNQSSIIEIRPVPIIETVLKSIDLFEQRSLEKNIQIIFKNSIHEEVHIAGDEKTLIEHIFSNAISNALKFSHRGSEIEVSLHLINGFVRVQFTDRGLGISPERLKKSLTQPFEGTEGEIGTGLGIVLMGYFLRKFGGRYSITSEGLGKGTVLCIELRKYPLK